MALKNLYGHGHSERSVSYGPVPDQVTDSWYPIPGAWSVPDSLYPILGAWSVPDSLAVLACVFVHEGVLAVALLPEVVVLY